MTRTAISDFRAGDFIRVRPFARRCRGETGYVIKIGRKLVWVQIDTRTLRFRPEDLVILSFC